MVTLIIGSIILSVLHALIPNHWLPVLAIARKEAWTLRETTGATLIAGFFHVLSTVITGGLIGAVGVSLDNDLETVSRFVAPVVLVIMGIFYIYQHHRHRHFELAGEVGSVSRTKIIASLALAMFFSPCFEIGGYFLVAGTYGWKEVIVLSVLYTVVTMTGMVVWVRLAYRGMMKLNWHALEHNAGIITGVTLVITGILTFIFY